ncbi:BTB/POZ domain-containing protein At5g66560 [Coffea arabica]|uniref:BTB/POZ domain-containing protein At5g66560 n=1 Tax=Coffea arabica TaxID=13443 RepID=A0A6P6TIK6_COFAR
MDAEKPSSKGQAWFCTTGLPSDVVIEVDDMTFHLHKFPLMSKSLKLHKLITEQEKIPKTTSSSFSSAKFQKPSESEKDDADDNNTSTNNKDDQGEIIAEEELVDDEDEAEYCHITLPDFPGGSEALETAAKFCYGVKIELSPSNVAALRCAGGFLQMTEEYSEDNLISKTERYLSQTVLRNIKDSIQTLHSCQKLLPLAENLGIVQRCLEAIASKTSSADPSLFGWPVSEGIAERAGNNARRKLTGAAAARGGGAAVAGAEVWFEELTLLSLEFFKRLLSAMKEGDASAEIIENCLVYYAKKYIPGISRANRKPSSSISSSSSVPSENEQRELLETVISNLPTEKSSSSSTTTRFLFGLLRTANILNCSDACRATLETKIGSQLEQATLDDLLIPSYSYLNETLYDVDCVERILGYFLRGLEERSASRIEGEGENSSVRSAALMLVGKLIDGYLSEIASDANLKSDRFYQLAISLPDHARLFDDGLYRAVDVYLKAHPWLSEQEREKICGILDCQKLTLEACTHAAQNERLPLRAVVQVLFFEQLQLRHAIAGTLLAADVPPALETGRQLEPGEEDEEVVGTGLARAGEGEGNGNTSTWRAAVRENQVLRLDMDSMRTRVHELERECSTMKKAIETIDKVGPRRERGGGGWRSKFGCKFKTQVCDSHESATVVEARKGRSHRHSSPK